MPDDAKVDELVEKLRAYLRENPDAADTVGGIATWWLGESDAEDAVRSAVERLVESGEMRHQAAGAGAALFARARL